jgi:type II secretory pathway component PulF
MSNHFQVMALFNNHVSDRTYFVSSQQAARLSASKDGAIAIYRIRHVKQNFFTKQLFGREYAMLLLRAINFQVEAGVSVVDAIQTSVESEPDKSKRSQLQGILDALARGASIADSLCATGLYDETIHSILLAGESTSGVGAIKSAMENLEDRKANWKTFAAVLSALFMELSTALTVPPTIQEYALPWIRKNLPKVSPEQLAIYNGQLDTIEFNNLLWEWISFGACAVVVGLVLAWFAKQSYKEWITNNILARTPLIGEWYANEAIFRSCKIFATMLNSGVQMNDAILTILRSTKNYVALRFWSMSYASLNTGASIGHSFASPGLLRKDEVLVLQSANGNSQIARSFLSISQERVWRQKVLSGRIFRASIMLMVGYVVVTMLIAFRLFGLVNQGLEMSMNSMTS